MNPPKKDVVGARVRSLRFQVSTKDGRGRPWTVVAGGVPRLEDALALATRRDNVAANETGVFVETSSGNFLYWTSRLPELFNSAVIAQQPRPALARVDLFQDEPAEEQYVATALIPNASEPEAWRVQIRFLSPPGARRISMAFLSFLENAAPHGKLASGLTGRLVEDDHEIGRFALLSNATGIEDVASPDIGPREGELTAA